MFIYLFILLYTLYLNILPYPDCEKYISGIIVFLGKDFNVSSINYSHRHMVILPEGNNTPATPIILRYRKKQFYRERERERQMMGDEKNQ